MNVQDEIVIFLTIEMVNKVLLVKLDGMCIYYRSKEWGFKWVTYYTLPYAFEQDSVEYILPELKVTG